MNDLLRIGSAFLPAAEGYPLCAGCPLLLAGTRAAPRLGSGDDSVFTAVFYKRGKWCSRLHDLLKVTLPMTAGPRPELHGPSAATAQESSAPLCLALAGPGQLGVAVPRALRSPLACASGWGICGVALSPALLWSSEVTLSTHLTLPLPPLRRP